MKLTYARPKRYFNGVPFPSFAMFAPPLYGTRIFPDPPRMEKFHFLHATAAPINHLDGTKDPDVEYLDQIMTHMNLKLAGWESATSLRILDENDVEKFNKVFFNSLPLFPVKTLI